MIKPVEYAFYAMANYSYSGIKQQLESIRLGRVAYSLMIAGCSPRGTFPGNAIANYLLEHQRDDGGWADVEETLWCLGYLATFGKKYSVEVAKGQKWLTSSQLKCGAWGKSSRDQARIPITALATILTPEVVKTSALEWLESQWVADLASPTQLTYKGAFFLLSQAHELAANDNPLIERTIDYLIEEQNGDGGFGPWKDHPIGSDPWSTGIVLWGLSKVHSRVSRNVIEKAVEWLGSTQLPNGLWPYHYIDDGSSIALIGLSSVLPILTEK